MEAIMKLLDKCEPYFTEEAKQAPTYDELIEWDKSPLKPDTPESVIEAWEKYKEIASREVDY